MTLIFAVLLVKGQPIVVSIKQDIGLVEIGTYNLKLEEVENPDTISFFFDSNIRLLSIGKPSKEGMDIKEFVYLDFYKQFNNAIVYTGILFKEAIFIIIYDDGYSFLIGYPKRRVVNSWVWCRAYYTNKPLKSTKRTYTIDYEGY